MAKIALVIALAAIEATVKTQARAELNKEALADYTAAAKEAKAKGADSPFPDLIVFQDEDGNKWLADGFTRRKALMAADFTETKCEVKKGTQRDAMIYAFTANNEHGARLTTADKLHNLAMAMKDPELKALSSNALAKILGVSDTFVNKNRPADTGERVAVRAGKKSAPMKTKGIGKKGGKAEKPAKEAKTPKAAKAKKGETPENKEPEAPKVPSIDDFDPGTQASMKKLRATIGGTEGDELFESLVNQKLDLSKGDIASWSQNGASRIKEIFRLFLYNGMKPKAALAVLDPEVTSKTKVGDLVLMAIAEDGKSDNSVNLLSTPDGRSFRVVCYEVGRAKIESSVIPRAA